MKQSEPDITEVIESLLYFRSDMKSYLQRKMRENELDITHEMLQVMVVLWTKGDRNQQEIADRLQKNKASLTSLIDNLEKRNLLKRTEDANDRRNKIISLTPTGAAYRKLAQPVLDNFFETVGEGVTYEDLRKVVSVFSKLRKNLQRD